jgi:antitoxin ParD1/3/4
MRRVDWHNLPLVDKISFMPTRNVVLTSEQANLVQSLVNSGRYQNASEVIREGLRLIERREVENAARLQALRDAADVGIAALDRGAFREFSEARSFEAYLNGIADELLGSGARQH